MSLPNRRFPTLFSSDFNPTAPIPKVLPIRQKTDKMSGHFVPVSPLVILAVSLTKTLKDEYWLNGIVSRVISAQSTFVVLEYRFNQKCFFNKNALSIIGLPLDTLTAL